MKRLSIAYITPEDPHSKRSWSGTNYYLMQAIEKYVGDVDALGPLSAQPEWMLCSALNFITTRLLGKRFNYRDSFIIARAYQRRIKRKLNQKHYDLIIAPAGTATLAGLNTSTPKVYINDRCIPGALNYHTILSHLLHWSEKESIAVEKKTVVESLLTIYSSDWATQAAVQAYPSCAPKIHTIPLGANFDVSPSWNPNKPLSSDTLKLLFVGVQWQSKGGDIAFEALRYLLDQKIEAELIVCGCQPPIEVLNHPRVVVEGFLNKDIPEQYARLQAHFAAADFLILPTRFEAYGLVFCEAAAYGLPVLATQTGGIPTIVEQHVTGYLFAPETRGDAYGKQIMGIISNPNSYLQMRHAARHRFEELLNWDAFGKKLQAMIAALYPKQ